MIVKMKKVALITTTLNKTECLKALRNLGVLHIKAVKKDNDRMAALAEERQEINEALQILSQLKVEQIASVDKAIAGMDGIAAVDEVLALNEARETAREEIFAHKKELDRLKVWGNLDPADFSFLREKGFDFHLYDIPAEILDSWEEDYSYLVLEKAKKRCKVALFCTPGEPFPEGEFHLPAFSVKELEGRLENWIKELRQTELRLDQYDPTLPAIRKELYRVEKALEFEQVHLNMEEEAELTVLTGFIPIDKNPEIKQAAAKQGWGLVISEPADDDPVPTLIRSPKWIGIVKPIFDMLGTVPGYREYDISFWFLLFFSLFFAMIIGDAGYGIVMLLLTILVRLKARKAPGTIFALLYVMCTSTIVWGALSGTWFGSVSLAVKTPLSLLVIPQISTVKELSGGIDSTYFIMNFCFVLGAVHLSIARLTNFFKRVPHLTCIAELGWLVLLWGLYFLVRNIVLQQDVYFLTPWLIGIGFGLVVLFSQQNGNFFKSIGKGLIRSPLTVLDAIGGFSDIISYVRLYAVGLATVEVARAWNIMATGIGFNSIIAGLIAGLILLAGHALNIIMGVMSIVVHGVRLNMLEFSGHLGMEWSGREYSPFRE